MTEATLYRTSGRAPAPTLSRPFVHLNAALLPDGSVRGAISCPADLRRVHGLRERLDGIAVGGETWRSDRPRLTAREEHLGRAPRAQPTRVVFSRQPINDRADVTSSLIVMASAFAQDDLRSQLHALTTRRVHSLLLEGGPRLWRSFLQARLVDEATVYVRTRSLPDALRAIAATLPELPLPDRHEPFGEGLLFHATPLLNRSVRSRTGQEATR